MRSLVLGFLFFIAPVLRAATYFVPSDAELIQRADDIVIAVGVTSLSDGGRTAYTLFVPSDAELIQRADDIVIAVGVTSLSDGGRTAYTLRIEEVLKGKRRAGQHLVLTELGGRAGERMLSVAGAPVYEPGVRYLVFTDSSPQGEPITFGMSLGQFELGARVARRHGISGFDRNLEPHLERERDSAAFITYIREIVARRASPNGAYFVEREREMPLLANATTTLTRTSYLLDGAFRWQGAPDANLVVIGAAPYDAVRAATRAIEEWNATETNIAYTLSDETVAATAGLMEPDGIDGILFGDPHDEIPVNVAASGGAWGDIDYTFDGEAFVRIVEADVVFNHPFTASESCFTTVMTHELGHTLGIRHANRSGGERTCPPTSDCTTDAIMRAEVSCGLDGHLRPWDHRAAIAVYGAGPEPPCTRADIASHSESATIPRGMAHTLTVTATGTAPIVYQWFIGERGDRTRPVESGQTVTVRPERSTRYWALATNACGEDTSAAVTITILHNGKRRSVGRR
jgi:hypothetical protein